MADVCEVRVNNNKFMIQNIHKYTWMGLEDGQKMLMHYILIHERGVYVNALRRAAGMIFLSPLVDTDLSVMYGFMKIQVEREKNVLVIRKLDKEECS